MYSPLFNHVLVEVDDKEANWGKGNNDNIGGEAYREGKVVEFGMMLADHDHPLHTEEAGRQVDVILQHLIGKHVMWNEGHEAGKTFEHDGKMYALVYWWDLVGVKDDSSVE